MTLGSLQMPLLRWDVPTEAVVVLPSPHDVAVGQDLQVEASPAVELPSAQDALQMGQVRGGTTREAIGLCHGVIV